MLAAPACNGCNTRGAPPSSFLLPVSAFAPCPPEQVPGIDVTPIARRAPQDHDIQMIAAAAAAGDQAGAGGARRARLDALVSFHVEQAVGVVPDHCPAFAV